MRVLLCIIYVVYSTVGPLNMFGSTSTQPDTAQRVVKNMRSTILNPPRSLGGLKSADGGSEVVQGNTWSNMSLTEHQIPSPQTQLLADTVVPRPAHRLPLHTNKTLQAYCRPSLAIYLTLFLWLPLLPSLPSPSLHLPIHV